MAAKFITKLIVSVFTLWAASYLLTGFTVTGGWQGYLIAGAILALLNMFVRPVLKFLSFPLIFLTLGLFSLIINVVMLWLAANLTGLIIISGLVPLILATLIITVINLVLD